MRLFLAALTLVMATTPAGAQWLDRKTPGIPRTADGKPNLTAPAPRGADGKPDLTGIWNGPMSSPVPTPTNLQPWVRDLVRPASAGILQGGDPPINVCRAGPRLSRFGGWKRILQTPTAIAILNDDLTYRVIHMDGRQLEADPAPSWMGYSVGRWEGDTLVVESNGFNDKTWTSRYGVSHTEALRTTERYRRTDFGHMQVEVTYTDPRRTRSRGALRRPWRWPPIRKCSSRSANGAATTGRARSSNAAPITVPPDVLARYVGVYSGTYGGRKRTIEVSLSGGQLIGQDGRCCGYRGRPRRRRSRPGRMRSRWYRALRRCSKGWDSAISSSSTTKVSRRTWWRFTSPVRTNSRVSVDFLGSEGSRGEPLEPLEPYCLGAASLPPELSVAPRKKLRPSLNVTFVPLAVGPPPFAR